MASARGRGKPFSFDRPHRTIPTNETISLQPVGKLAHATTLLSFLHHIQRLFFFCILSTGRSYGKRGASQHKVQRTMITHSFIWSVAVVKNYRTNDIAIIVIFWASFDLFRLFSLPTPASLRQRTRPVSTSGNSSGPFCC